MLEYGELLGIRMKEGRSFVGSYPYVFVVVDTDGIDFITGDAVVLRVPDGTDVPKAKQTLLDNANPAKWICVEAESVAVESIEDVILYVMGFDEDVSAIKDAFLALDE